jgi:cytochrome oxidase Cu insertion factor (SCO1/SenC/PrrC family)
VKGGLAVLRGISTVLRGISTVRRATWLAGVALAAAVALAGCSSASSQPSAMSSMSSASSAAEANPNLDLGSSLGNKKAADFTLTNQFGQQMSLSQFRGKVVVLSFMDAECTDVCPLESASMVLAKELLGKAGDAVQLLSIDANPDANKVSDVMSYSRAHSMVNQWDYLTGSDSQLEAVWKNYNVEVQVVDGDIDHTPAVYVIDAHGDLAKLYLTQMAYSSVTQSAQVIAGEAAALLPSHPKLSSIESLAAIPTQTPTDAVSLPAATAPATVTLGPGKARLVVFFATWLTETSDLKAELTSLNSYVKDAAARHLPALTTVDETVTETSKQAVTSFLGTLGPLDYPVGMDETGRLADGYGVQDQPWLVLVNAAGKVTWQHDGWVPVSTVEQAAQAHG